MTLHGWVEVDIYEGRTDLAIDEMGVTEDLQTWFDESMFAYKQDLFLQFLNNSGIPYSAMQHIRRDYTNSSGVKDYTVFTAVLNYLKKTKQIHCLIRFLRGEEHSFDS